MPLRAEIEQQETLEREQIRGGLDKLRKDTLKKEKSEYASATVYGSASITTLLPTFIKYLDERKQERIKAIKTKGVGSQIALMPYLLALDTESQALIAAKLTFDKLFSPRRKNQLVISVTEAIGHALEAECQMQYYEQVAPPLFAVLKENYWHQAKGTEYKRKSMQTIMNKYDIVPWKSWNSVKRVQLGGFLLECLQESSGWFTDVVIQGRKKTTYVTITEHFLKHKEAIVRLTELFSPLSKPMLIEPRDWSTLHDGGYYLNELTKCHEMVRRGELLSIQGKTTYQFLNKIQKVKYRLNDFIIEVAKELEEREVEVGKFRPVINHPIPPKPADFDTNKDSKKQWKREAAIAHNKNHNEWRISCRTRMTMNCVREFEGKDFYIPWSFDYRGRAYPIPSFLTPQDTDFGKSLLRFSEESEITEDGKKWLAFQVATTYGLDKATMDERLAWVSIEENRQRIIRVARDPINNIGDWETADEPWQFLAACHEYYSVVIAGKKTTGLPVATDATCSGIQILAGLCRCKKTAAMVNVLPSNKPQDAYQVIADQSRPHIPERLRPYWDRKKTKRTVMTIPYNAKPFSNRQYIRDAFKDIDIEVEKEELTQIVKAVRDAMEAVVPGPMRVMRWIESEVSKAIKNGAEQLVWVTPSGFRVTQRLMKRHYQRVVLQLFGTTNLRVGTDEEKGVDLLHHKNATAPNLIHSLDASLLHIAATQFDAPISLIHDSVLCRATDMTYLSTLVRNTYMHLFAKHDFLKTFAQAIGAKTEPPIIGDLEPSEVIESTYFFC
jgi:DNA-directed RNA polymerase